LEEKHPMCMYYWSWKENTQCVCITNTIISILIQYKKMFQYKFIYSCH
jgi:hypothetical protein